MVKWGPSKWGPFLRLLFHGFMEKRKKEKARFSIWSGWRSGSHCVFKAVALVWVVHFASEIQDVIFNMWQGTTVGTANPPVMGDPRQQLEVGRDWGCSQTKRAGALAGTTKWNKTSMTVFREKVAYAGGNTALCWLGCPWLIPGSSDPRSLAAQLNPDLHWIVWLRLSCTL